MLINVPNWTTTVDDDPCVQDIRNTLVADFNSQIDNLVLAARDERPDAMGLILSQDGEFFSDFLAVLTIRPATHPQTWRVLNIASLIGSFAALYLKGKWDLPRPTQICPALLPPIPVPGHSSWPSGHSTQAHLMKNCMLRIFAATATTPMPMPAADQNVWSADLTVLADEIARNREIAGLHYPGGFRGRGQVGGFDQ